MEKDISKISEADRDTLKCSSIGENEEKSGKTPLSPTPPMLIREISRLCRMSMRSGYPEFGGMKYSRRAILAYLSREDGATQQSLALASRLSAPTVSIEVAEMEKAGLVVRGRSSSDGRAVTVNLTDAGREINERFNLIMAHDEEIMLTGIDAEEYATLERLLTKMRDNLLMALSGDDGK